MEVIFMSVSYKKLWKILIDRDMTKTQLIQQAKITTNAIAMMSVSKPWLRSVQLWAALWTILLRSFQMKA